MADPILRKIRAQQTACMLTALRSWAITEERWQDPIHQPAYDAKLAELKERWLK